MKRKAISVCLAIAIVLTLIPFGTVISYAEDELQSSEKGLTLSSGTYSVNQNITVTNSTAGGSGITIEPNSTVNIYIPEGVTLTAIGADGDGATGGGAGIWIPSSSTLNIYGGGAVSAFGGNAGDGVNGGKGGTYPNRLIEYLKMMYSWFVTGSITIHSTGGAGGEGGGGAGAGIGTPGANGLEGGLGGFTASYKESGKNEQTSNIDGKSGEDAVSADRMGTLVSTDITFKATGGGGGAGGEGGEAKNLNLGFYSSVGAGGGGGGGGYAAASIGNGGDSGASGGGGGTSPYNAKESYYDTGGEGGAGNFDGDEGEATKTSRETGGLGGAGGIEGMEGSAKSFKISYNLSGGKLPSGSTKNYTFGKSVTLPTPEKSGYKFIGWHTDLKLESGIVKKIGLREAGNKNFYAEWNKIPEISVNEDNIVLNYNDYEVENLSLAYIGKEEKTINDWDTFVNAGLQFTNINGTTGYKQYESPEDGMSVPQSKTGYYAACINYLADGVETNKYQVVYLQAVEAVPEVQVSEGNIVVVANDYTVSKVSLAYIGTESMTINDWASFVNAGTKYKDINGTSGYKQYASPKDGASIPQTTTGYYAAYIRYIDNGVTINRYQVVYLEAEKAVPEVQVSDNNIVIKANDYTVSKVSLAYIGTEAMTINDWASFVNAGTKYKDINGSTGYKQYASPKDGASIPQTATGYYAAYIRYIDNGVTINRYQVVYLEAEKAVPEVQVSDNNIVIKANDYTVSKVSLAYIGTESMTINDWASFVNAGTKYKDINGSTGYKQYASPKDGASIPQTTTGYYAAYIRYIDNGVTINRYQVVYLEAEKAVPEVQVSDNNIVIKANDYTVSKVSLAYIGTEAMTINDWASFVNAGTKYKDINSSTGYKQYASPKDGASIPQTATGYYAAYIRYVDNGVTINRYQVVYLEAEKAVPEVQVSGNSIVVKANGYTVDKVSLAYIGTESMTINDWTSFVNAGTKYKSVNGSTGYKQYASPKDGTSIPQSTTGYYAAYIRYIDNGVKVIEYQTVYVA